MAERCALLRACSAGTTDNRRRTDWKKPLPDMHIPGSLEDSAPDAPGWIRDVVCEHGGLQPILNKRVQISAEVGWLLLRDGVHAYRLLTGCCGPAIVVPGLDEL